MAVANARRWRRRRRLLLLRDGRRDRW